MNKNERQNIPMEKGPNLQNENIVFNDYLVIAKIGKLTIISVAATKNQAYLLSIIRKLCKALHGIQQAMGKRNKTPAPSGMR